MISVYIAMPLACCEVARAWKVSLEKHGIHVVSTWHDVTAKGMTDPHSPMLRRHALNTNLSEIGRCDVLVADTRAESPSATFGEIGYAIATSKRVIWVQPEAKFYAAGVIKRVNIFDAHDRVKVVYSASDTALLLLEWSKEEAAQ